MLYEILELENGDVVLQREGDAEGEPLVVMRFSNELMRYFKDAKIDIAKIMIEAGLEHVAKLADEHSEKLGLSRSASESVNVERLDEEYDSENHVSSGSDSDASESDSPDSGNPKEKNHLVH
ncbi:hypothetical protein NBRC116492_21530 [Aurantivibrio infirmus]